MTTTDRDEINFLALQVAREHPEAVAVVVLWTESLFRPGIRDIHAAPAKTHLIAGILSGWHDGESKIFVRKPTYSQ